MPPGGALLQVIEYARFAPTGRPLRVPRLPRRPVPFLGYDGTWANFECAARASNSTTARTAAPSRPRSGAPACAMVEPRLKVGALRIPTA